MTPYLTCDAALELLEAFVDDELVVEQQVAVESHLRWCRVCEARVADLRLIGGSMRLVGMANAAAGASAAELTGVQSGVLARIRAERDQSLATQLRGMFVDMRLLWPALGASAAVVTCLFAASGVLAAATAEDNSKSMAAMIEMLAHPGSDRNPLWLDPRISAPRALDASMVVDSIVGDDAVYAVSAVVTREGRVSDYEMLLSERDSVRRRYNGVAGDAPAAAVLDAVKRSRFEPAQLIAGGPVAVNVVWLVARTTVKGTPETVQPRPPSRVTATPPPATTEPPETPAPQPPVTQSGAAGRSPTA